MTREEKLTLSKQYVLDRFTGMSIEDFNRYMNTTGTDVLIDECIVRYNLLDAGDQHEIERIVNEMTHKFQRFSDEVYNFMCIIYKSYVETHI